MGNLWNVVAMVSMEITVKREKECERPIGIYVLIKGANGPNISKYVQMVALLEVSSVRVSCLGYSAAFLCLTIARQVRI
jgi:hypothetical protein